MRGPDPLTAAFRLHPDVDLVVFDRLDAERQARLAPLARDPGFYGLLITPSTTKAVDRDSALLLLTLRTPGPIPGYAVRALGADARRRILGWVLDGVLEMEHEGAFHSGPAAAALVARDVDAEGVIGRLSVEALRYAAGLETRDASMIAGRLYRYNRIPLSPRYARSHAMETDEDRLGLAAPRAASILARCWTRTSASGTPWISWIARRDGDRPMSGGSTYKLYVSPAADAVRHVFPDVVAAVTPHRPYACKVGKGPHGLLRPDKMVIYFARRDDLHEAAGAVVSALAGAPAHGVPFSSAISADGLVSWGIDPPADDGMMRMAPSESWRERLTNQMGAAFVAAPRGSDGVDTVVRFVLLRLEAHGVDPITWAPA